MQQFLEAFGIPQLVMKAVLSGGTVSSSGAKGFSSKGTGLPAAAPATPSRDGEASARRAKPPEDLTGRSRMARNVVFSWGGYAVNVVAGFIMPRMISDHLGQTTLGIWDFSWSVVSYFGLVQLGLGGSVDRYVAKHRAVGDTVGLSRSVSTIALFLKVASLLCAVVTAATVLWILPLFQHRLGAELAVARWVVLFLGLEITASLALTVYGAVIVGCHRWDIHNSISAGTYAVIAVGMVTTLLAGGSLPALALVHLLATVGGDLLRWQLAGRVCPELHLRYRNARWDTLLEQARYSAKNLIPRIADLVSNQSLALLIASYLGPATLAVYSRPRNLMRQFQTIAAKFGYILIPTASSLQAQEAKASLQQTFQGASLFIVAIVLPAVATLSLFGDDLIQLWMGRDYVHPGLMLVLAIGCLPTLVQEPVWSILSGMNRHGWIAASKLMAALLSATLLWAGLAMVKCDLLEVALVFALPQMVIDGFGTPWLACRRLGVSLFDFYQRTYVLPLLCVGPYAGCLFLARLFFRQSPLASVALGIGGILALLLLYWGLIIPPGMKCRLIQKLASLVPLKAVRGWAEEASSDYGAGLSSATEVPITGKLESSKRIIVIFRNDDPSALSDLAHEAELFALFEHYGVPQTIGVIPRTSLTDYHDPQGVGERALTESPEVIRFLSEHVRRTGSEIALHGYTHRTNRFSNPRKREYFEFRQLPVAEQQAMIAAGTEVLEQAFGKRPVTFIPPWNRLDGNTVLACAANGYKCISAGPYLRTARDIHAFGMNSTIASFAADYAQAKRARQRVFINVNFHSRTVRSQAEKEVLRQVLETVSQDPECEALTISQAMDKYSRELQAYNEAGQSIAPLYSTPGSLRGRAWVYCRTFEWLTRTNYLKSLQQQAREYYARGDYEVCGRFNAPIDKLCKSTVASARCLAGVGGAVLGAAVALLHPAQWFSGHPFHEVLLASGLFLGVLIAQRATTSDSRRELTVSALISASAAVFAALVVIQNRLT